MPALSERTTGRIRSGGNGTAGLTATSAGSSHCIPGSVKIRHTCSWVRRRSVIRRPSVPTRLNVNPTAAAITGT